MKNKRREKQYYSTALQDYNYIIKKQTLKPKSRSQESGYPWKDCNWKGHTGGWAVLEIFVLLAGFWEQRSTLQKTIKRFFIYMLSFNKNKKIRDW